MKGYIGVWTSRKDMLQMEYKRALEFYAECGITTIIVGYLGSHAEYYRHIDLPVVTSKEEPPTLRDICKMAGDVGIKVEVVVEPKCMSLAKRAPEISVVDVFGNRGNIGCLSHPKVISYVQARIRDILENHKVMGIELDGAYIDMHPRMTNPRGQPGALYPYHHVAPESCFCKYCRSLAKEEGIDIDRIEETVKKITKISLELSSRNFYRAFDTFRGQYDMIRFIMKYPELIDWLNFRCKVISRFLEQIKRTVKAIDPNLTVSHDMLPPTWSWSIGQDYAGQKDYCDNYKIVFYHKRVGSFEVNPLIAIRDKIPDVNEDDIIELYKRLVGYEGPPSITYFSQHGFPSTNIYYELRKAREEVGPDYKLIAGIVGDAPATPTDIEEAIIMAAKGGADGFCLHTWYGRTPPSNYAAFGNKARELLKAC